jgi:hypothetical protein
MDPECAIEKQYLIKLIKKYKILFQMISKNEETKILITKQFLSSLQETYEETQKKMIDPDYFICLLGSNFEAECQENDEDGEELINNIDDGFENSLEDPQLNS